MRQTDTRIRPRRAVRSILPGAVCSERRCLRFQPPATTRGSARSPASCRAGEACCRRSRRRCSDETPLVTSGAPAVHLRSAAATGAPPSCGRRASTDFLGWARTSCWPTTVAAGPRKPGAGTGVETSRAKSARPSAQCAPTSTRPDAQMRQRSAATELRDRTLIVDENLSVLL